MKLERMEGEDGVPSGWRLLVWRKTLPEDMRDWTWKTESHKLAIRLFKDTYGWQFSVTVAT